MTGAERQADVQICVRKDHGRTPPLARAPIRDAAAHRYVTAGRVDDEGVIRCRAGATLPRERRKAPNLRAEVLAHLGGRLTARGVCGIAVMSSP